MGRLGPYRVVKVLGVGGMGVVFQAEDLQLQRLVALKVMRSGVLASALARQRFLREALTCAAIDHEHIVTLLQVGEDRGIPYLAMQLLQGETLEERLKREEKLPLAEVLRIGYETATGLAAAHERGLIHRDIKPANIWLEALPGAGEPSRPRCRVKILDFGLARAVGEAHLTQNGRHRGHAGLHGSRAGRGRGGRSALTCSASAACSTACVRDSFRSKAPPRWPSCRTLELEQPQPPHLLNPDVPQTLSDLILTLLAKRPEDRSPSARTVVEALEAIREGRALVARPPHRRRRRLALAAAMGLTVLGLVCYLFGPAVLRLTIHRDLPSALPLTASAMPSPCGPIRSRPRARATSLPRLPMQSALGRTLWPSVTSTATANPTW